MRSKKMKRDTTSTSSSNNCAKKEKRKDEARALLEEMKKFGGGPSQSLCNGTEGIWQVRRVHADVDRGPWATTIWQMLQSNDTKTLNLAKDFEELVGHGTTSRVVGSDKTHGTLD